MAELQRQMRCPDCEGRGTEPNPALRAKQNESLFSLLDRSVSTNQLVACSRCGGAGKVAAPESILLSIEAKLEKILKKLE